MATAGSIRIGVTAGVSGFRKDMKQAQGVLFDFNQTMKVGPRITFDFFNGLQMIAGAAGSATRAVNDLVMASADQAEAADLVRIQYGASADIVMAKADELAENFGAIRTEFLSGVGTLEGLLGQMGKTGDETATLAGKFGELALDMESAFNSRFEDELVRIRAGLAGESEPLRRYGVDLLEANVKQEAYRLGLAKVGDELTTAMKTEARASIIFNDLTKIMGNKALTADSTANKVKELSGRMENLKADVGGAVEVISNSLFVVMSEGVIGLTEGFSDVDQEINQWAKSSLQTGGTINETFGVIGDGIAMVLDGGSYFRDTFVAIGATLNNIFARFFVTIIDVGQGIAELIDMIPGVETEWDDFLSTYSDTYQQAITDLVDSRDDLFQGSDWADNLREFTDSAQSRLNELGSVVDTALVSPTEAEKKVTEAISTDTANVDKLSSALSFGSSEALSAINRNASGGKDETVKVAKDQLSVQRQTLVAIRQFGDKVINRGLELLDI